MKRLLHLTVNQLNVPVAIDLDWTTFDHIFITGHFATFLWMFFSGVLEIQHETIALRNCLMKWWITKHNNEAHKLILQATPIFVAGIGVQASMDQKISIQLELNTLPL